MTRRLYFFIIVLLFNLPATAQPGDGLIYLRISSAHSSFPDTARANGHLYKNVVYDAASHYADSSLLIICPKQLSKKINPNLIFWFHGWFNHIDSANERFALARQLAASGSDAVLVIPETAKDAPDSYGGKLEQPGMFEALVNDVLTALKKNKLLAKKVKPGAIILAGHSGGYRVMARILANNRLPVAETILFDALYAETDKFLNWINADSLHRFINIYTNEGGTVKETNALLQLMAGPGNRNEVIEEDSLTAGHIRQQRLLVIHSKRQHNDIINDPDNLRLFLENSPVLKKLKQ